MRRLSAPHRRALDEQVERMAAILEAIADLTLDTLTVGPHP
ncbi:hypothetical protein AB0O22_37065 [Streptomyces sp. NPDC091204]